MATTSQVKDGLNEISEQIKAVRTRYESQKSAIEGGASALGNIPTRYSDVLATIDGYTGADAFETLSQSEKQRLADEFVELKATIDALIATTEFSA